MSLTTSIKGAGVSDLTTDQSDPGSVGCSAAKNAPLVRVRDSGVLGVSDQAKKQFREHPGVYRLVRTDSLLMLLPERNTGTAPSQDETLVIAGSLREILLVDLLGFFGHCGASGRLVIKEGPVERVIVLVDGGVTAIATNAESERFGVFVARFAPVSETDLDIAAKEAAREGIRMGQMLLRKGLIDKKSLRLAIRAQITEVITLTMLMREGSFVLYRSDGQQINSPISPIPMQGILLDASRRADEMGGWPGSQ